MQPARAILALILSLVLSPTAIAQSGPAPARAALDEIHLRSGDVLRGHIVQEASRLVVIHHPDLGRLSILRTKIARISTQPVPAPADPNTDAEPEQAETRPTEPETPIDLPPEREWKYSLSFGSVMTNDEEGEKLSINSGFTAERIRPTSETRLRAAYFFKLDDGEVDDHEAYVLLDQRYRRAGSPWYWTARPRYDYDEFRSWRQRLQIHGALGLYLIEQPDVRWSIEGGAGFRRDFGAENAADVYEGLVGTVLDWRLTDRQRFNLDLHYYPQIGSPDERLVTRLDWAYRLAEQADLSLKIGLEHEYATDPDPGFPEHNVRFVTGIELSF